MADTDSENVRQPTKYNPTTIGKLIEAFNSDYTIEQACRFANISRDTYYEWIKTHDGFGDRMEDAQTKLLQKAGEIIALSLSDGDANTARWLKDRRDPRYKSKVEAVITEIDQRVEERLASVLSDGTDDIQDNSKSVEAGSDSETQKDS
jgi:hypothetical protein